MQIVRCEIGSKNFKDILCHMSELESDEKGVIIVPDQFSYIAEKYVSQSFGGTGLNNRHVLTFKQMKRMFLNLSDDRYLSSVGKKMLLKKAVNAVIDENSVFYSSKNSIGFLESLSSILCEFKNYCITPQMLDEGVSGKIADIRKIYSKYEELITSGGYLDSEDDLLRVSNALKDNKWFSSAHVWIDMFSDFSPQHIKIIESILLSGANLTVYVAAGREVPLEGSVYEYPERLVNKLEALCKRLNLECSQVACKTERRIKPAISAYIQNFEIQDYKYSDNAEEIKIFQAKDKYSELEHTAMKIADLVHEDGYNYSDIAVVFSDIDEYITFAEPVFAEYGIPIFADYKTFMQDHPITALFTSLFDILENNSWSYDACMRYLRTGYVCSLEDADALENHILRRGIKGGMWLKSSYWTIHDKKVFDDITEENRVYETEFLDLLRQRIVKPIISFKEKTARKADVKQMCTALFEFAEEIDLYNSLEKKVQDFKSSGRENEAARLEQVWNMIVTTLEQAVNTIGEESVNREEFYEFFLSGISDCEISIIPAVTDGISVSSTDRGVTADIRALFILGANKNVLPRVSGNDSLLSDIERDKLYDAGIELAPNTAKKQLQSEFNAVNLIASATDILHISFPVSELTGQTLEASQLVYDILEMFDKADKSDNLVEDTNPFLYISSPEATLHKLLLKLSDEKGTNMLWEKVRAWYERDGKWNEKLRLLDTAARYKELTASLSAENAKLLYEGYTNYSISKIEKFFECPFKYFLENGLKLKEREEWSIGNTDTGTLLHWAVCKYCEMVDDGETSIEKRKENWNNLTHEKSVKIVKKIMGQALEKVENYEFGLNKINNILRRIENALLKSIEIINLSFQNSKYIGAAYERVFEEKDISNADGNVKIKGIIDRIDIFEDEVSGNAYIRIIDYKSGKKGYSIERILNHVDLQLAVYAIAASDMYRQKEFDGFSGELNPVVSGIFYDKINNRLVECRLSEESFAEQKRLIQSKLDGVIFSEEIEQGKSSYFDTGRAQDMDYELESKGESRYLKAVKKTKGEGLDKIRSSSESEAVCDVMLKSVKNSLIDADKRIKSGEIDVSPYRYTSTTQSACLYCPYSSICASDREKSPCANRGKTKKELLDELMGE